MVVGVPYHPNIIIIIYHRCNTVSNETEKQNKKKLEKGRKNPDTH
jgi:hypothetical protein